MQRTIADTIGLYRRVASGIHEHARKCKKTPLECKQCVSGIKFFNALDVRMLSQVLEEIPVRRRQLRRIEQLRRIA